jgi:hypothetical protein
MSLRKLVIRDGTIGMMKGKEFIKFTNFSIEIKAFASTPDEYSPVVSGFVFHIESTDGVKTDCFVSTNDLQNLRSFVAAAGKCHNTLFYAKISDTLWSGFMLDMSQDFIQNSHKKMTLVTAVGKQASSEVWVLGPTVHVDKYGELIPEDNQTFFWCSNYLNIGQLDINLPLTIEPLKALLDLTKKCLRNNFCSAFLALAGGIVIFHFEAIQDLQDECPIILCYSKQSGTGIHFLVK